MKILQLTSARHLGGGERHFIDLTNALGQRGHDVFVALIPDSPLLPELQVPSGNILSLPLRNALDLASAWKLKEFVRDRQIEIVHAHVARDYPLAALAIGRSGPAKLVLSRHVMFPMSGLHRLTRRRVSRVIAVSQAVASKLRSQNIFDERQIALVRHGIDLDRFQLVRENPQTQRKDGRLRVGMLGELSPVKGQTDFVRAAAVIAAARDDVEFMILGRDNSGSGENRRQIEKLIEEVGLAKRMKLVESIDDTAVFLRGLDVFVSASRSEAFGLAIVEAMACGTAVVATMSEGAREIIEDNRTGRLVEIGVVAEMAQAVSELLSDGQKRKVLSANASTIVAERFSLKRMVDETEAVYREVTKPMRRDGKR